MATLREEAPRLCRRCGPSNQHLLTDCPLPRDEKKAKSKWADTPKSYSYLKEIERLQREAEAAATSQYIESHNDQWFANYR